MGNKLKTVKARVWLLFCVLVCILIVFGVFTFNGIKTLTVDLNQVADSDVPAVRNMTLIDMMHDGIRGVVFNAIVASSENNLEELKTLDKELSEMAHNIEDYLKNLSQLHLSAEIKSSIEASAKDVTAYTEQAKTVVAKCIGGNLKEAKSLLPLFSEKYEILEKSLEKIGESVIESSKVNNLKAHEDTDSVYKKLLLSGLIGLITAFILSYLFIRDLQSTLTHSVAELAKQSRFVSDNASQMRDISHGLNESTTRQASALHETAASLDEITAMLKKTEENSVSLEGSSQATMKSTETGKIAMTELFSSIQEIQDSISKIVVQIEDGNRKVSEIVHVISEIGEKTRVINDIVFQTKLLSFNASVEAARAGEHGKGFAVVAEEVGNLAQMSGNAAKEISEMLTSGIDRVSEIISYNERQIKGLITEGKSKLEKGVELSQNCEHSFEQILSQTKEVGGMVSEITSAIKEQTVGIDEISKAISILNKTTEENTASAKSASESADSLLKQSSSLSEIVIDLQSLIEGNKKDEENLDYPESVQNTVNEKSEEAA